MTLILDGQIAARIDSHNKILIAKDADQRCSTYEKAMQMGNDYVRRTRALILRSAMLKSNILVQGPPRDAGGAGSGNEASITPSSGSTGNLAGSSRN